MNQIYACRKGRELPFTGTTRMTTTTKAPDSSGRSFFAKLLMGVFVFLAFGALNSYGQVSTYATNGTYNFVVPPGITSLRIDVTSAGGGGAGFAGGAGVGGGGGGGGSFQRYTCAVTPGQTLQVVVGQGGQGGAAGANAGLPGGITNVTALTGPAICPISQAGAAGGTVNTGGNGATATSSGGNGGDGEVDAAGQPAAGGGGGGAATLAINGTNGGAAFNDVPGIGGTLGGAPGGPITGGTAPSATANGGGGGGAGGQASNWAGGNGGNGMVVVTTLIAGNPACPTLSAGGPYGPFCQTNAPVCLVGTPSSAPPGALTVFSGTGVQVNGACASGYQFNPTVAGPGCHTITYTYTDPNPGGCGVLTATTQILVYPTSPVIPQPANTCNSGVVVTATPVANFTQQYSFDNGATFGNSNVGPAATGCYSITSRYVNTAACGATPANTPGPCANSAVVNALNYPSSPVLAQPANTCNTGITVTPAAANGFVQQYSFNGGATFQNSNVGPSTPGCYVITSRFISNGACGVTPANTPGPCANSAPVSALVYPTTPAITAPAPVCQGGTFALPAVADQTANGFTTQYQITPPGGFSAAPVMPVAPGSYAIVARYVNTSVCGATPAGTAGPCANSNSVNTAIVATPTVADPADQTVCCTTPVSTTLVSPAGNPAGGTYSYTYTNDNPNIGLPAAGSAVGNQINFTAQCNPLTETGNITVTPSYTYTAPGGGTVTCTGPTQTYSVTVRPVTKGIIQIPANQTICAGQQGNINVDLNGTPPFTGTFNLRNTTTNVTTTYTWTSPIVGGPQNIPIPPANVPNATNTPITYEVTWASLTDAGPCAASPANLQGQANITVNPLPAIQVTRSPVAGTVCPGTSVTWTVTAAPGNTVPATFNYTITASPAAAGYPINGSNVPYGTPITATTPACPYNGTLTFTATPFADQAPNCGGSTITNSVISQDVTPPVFGSSGSGTFDRCDAAGIAAARAFTPSASNSGCTGAPVVTVLTPEQYTPTCGYTGSYLPGKTGTLVTVYQATEPCGGVSTITKTITIVDNTAPTWTSAAGSLNQTVEYCNNAALTSAQGMTPTFTDQCAYPSGSPAVNVVKTPGIFAVGSCPTRGTITNTFTVTDPCGNVSSTFTQVITITDNTGPSITGANAQTLNIGAGANCQVSLPNYINGTGGIAPNSPLTPLTITDCAAPGGLFPAPPPIVWNQAGGNGTAVQNPAPGTLIIGAGGQVVPVTVTATDACGNQSTFTINVTLLDQTPPVARCHNATVALSGAGTATINPTQINGNNNNVPGLGTAPSGTPSGSGLGTGTFPSTDNCSPVPTPPLTLTFSTNNPTSTTRNFTCADIGSVPVTLVVTDAAGNASNCTSTITVVDNIAPTFTCPGTQTIAKNANCIAVLPNFQSTLGIVASDNCTPSGSMTWTQNPVPGTIYGAGVTSTNVTLTATDGNGNVSTTCNITVNFVDNTPPQITCPPTVNAVTGAGNTNCNVAVTYTLPTAQDNCQGPGFPGAVPVTLVSGPASGSQFFVGTTPVTYRATDAAGNSSTCTFNVVVADNTIPTVVCQADKTVSAGAGCVFTYNLGNAWNPAPFDNCLLAAIPYTWTLSGATSSIPFVASNLNGITFNLGTTQVSVTVKDASNNVSVACTFNVTVVDNALPSFASCPSSFTTTTATNGLSGCRANVTLPVPTTTQNCTTVQEWFITSITSGTPNSSGVGAFPTSYPMNLGVTQVQYRLSDANGNSTTCTYNVTVNNGNAGAITGTATAAQNAATTSTITFTGSGGTPNYCFTYDVSVNGGPFGAPQTVCTTGGQSVVTVAQSNAVVGTYQYRILSMTDANGCSGTIPSAPNNVATVTVVAGTPDLTSSQFFTTTQISAGGVIDEVIVLRNVGSAPTSGLISFTITNYTALTGLTVTQIASGTNVTVGIDTYTMSAGWTFNPGTGTFTSTNVIPAGGSNNIGIRITRGTGGSAGANGSVTQTTTIAPGTGGGETPSTNNTISNTLLKN